jgi:hypothetical protein
MAETSLASRYHAALKAVIKRAIIVLDALGDFEMTFQNQGQVWNRAVNDAVLAYGYTEATVRFIPTAREIAQAEVVADWLLWLGNNDGASAGLSRGPTMSRSGGWLSGNTAASGPSTAALIDRWLRS